MNSHLGIVILVVFCFADICQGYFDERLSQLHPIISAQSFSDSPDVFYISFASPLTSPIRPPANEVELTDLQNADDTPFHVIKLPWQFNLFGEGVDYIFASPNGALHISASQPCRDCNCFRSVQCTFNTSYYGVVAGFLTDLFPHQSDVSNVTVAVGPSVVSVTYTDVPLFGSPKNNTFRISLFEDSSVELDWGNINPPPKDPWIVGLRPPATGSRTNFTANQLAIGINQWKTSVPGIYPLKSDCRSGMSFTACHMSTVWVASPSSLLLSASANLTLTLRPLSVSCLDKIDIVIYIASVSGSAVTADLSAQSADVVLCSVSNVVGNQGDVACNMTLLPVSRLVPSSITIQVGWRVSGSDDSFSPLAFVTPIAIQFLANASTTPSSSHACAASSPVAGCSNSICSLWTRDLQCMNLECDSAADPILYKYFACNQTCSSSADVLYSDRLNTCCNVTDVDCSGVCYGKAEVAVDQDNVTKCCTTTVDCSGECDGKKQFDACGICGGSDEAGLSCNTGVTVSTDSSTPNTVFADFSLADKVYMEVVYINISNTNSTDIEVSMSILNDNARLAPTILNVSPLVSRIVANSWQRFALNVSIARLVAGIQSGWEVKTLLLSIRRPSMRMQLTYPVHIYPVAHNCSVITTTMCSRLPGCILCEKYPGARILLAGDDVDDREHRTRSLYPNILPNEIAHDTLPHVAGWCSDGWRNMDCAASEGSFSGGEHNFVCGFPAQMLFLLLLLLFI